MYFTTNLNHFKQHRFHPEGFEGLSAAEVQAIVDKVKADQERQDAEKKQAAQKRQADIESLKKAFLKNN